MGQGTAVHLCAWTGDFPPSWGERQWASVGKIFSFRVVNTKTQVQFEIHSRKEESLANILRPGVKGILVDGLQARQDSRRKLRWPTETCKPWVFFFLSGNRNCLYGKHRRRWPPYLDKVDEFSKH